MRCVTRDTTHKQKLSIATEGWKPDVKNSASSSPHATKMQALPSDILSQQESIWMFQQTFARNVRVTKL